MTVCRVLHRPPEMHSDCDDVFVGIYTDRSDAVEVARHLDGEWSVIEHNLNQIDPGTCIWTSHAEHGSRERSFFARYWPDGMPTSSPHVLSWDYHGDGTWSACSAINDDGSSFEYRIGVCDDGTFDVSESDSELVGTGKRPCLPTLRDAKLWCENNESEMVEKARKECPA